MHCRVAVVVYSVCLSVCVSVTTRSAAYLIFMWKTKFHRVLYGVSKVFVVWLSLKTLRSRVFDVICWSPPPSLLLGELSTDKRDSNGSFSPRKACMVSHRSNKMTGSLLIVMPRLEDKLLGSVPRLLTRHYCMAHMILLDIMQSHAMRWPGY
jgi:hypothetical protein